VKEIRNIYKIALRECKIMQKNFIYLFCMIIFPIIVVYFFTSLMSEGIPTNMPVGIVDNDNTSTSRSLARNLDAFQTSHIVANFGNMNEARHAIQKGDIYAFLYIPAGTEAGLMRGSQPKISFYYSNVTLVAGSMTYKDLKTTTMLGSAGVGMRKLAATGKSNREIKNFLQPITVDLHMVGNPWSNYNVYLSTCLVPGLLMLFILLITPYSIGTELKFRTSRQWMRLADNKIWVAIFGKILPQTLIFLTIFYAFEFYIYYYLNFPHPGGVSMILLEGLLAVISCQGFGIFIFGLIPSLRMSMSVCSLWSVVSFSASGATYPLFAMDGFIQSVANLFPLRHYYMIYQIGIFNGFPISESMPYIMALLLFAILPVFTVWNIKKAMLIYVYTP